MAIIIIQGPAEKARKIHYEVDTTVAPIGAGGMGQVMRGVMVDETTGQKRDVAIKFLFDDLPESAIERSRREASVQLKNDNLVEMLGFIETESTDAQGNTVRRYHIASELLDGVMLHDLLHGKTVNAAGQTIPYAQKLYDLYTSDRQRFAKTIVTKVLSGVMALHDAGYIHRDIDPSNVMVTSDGNIKLIDFGICKKLDELGEADRHLTSAGQFMGKAAYASPELVVGDVMHQNPATDLYAIGIMFYQLLTGAVPFDGPTHEVLARQLKEAVPVKNIPDKNARRIVQKATAKKQADRYASAAEFRVDVDKLATTATKTNPGTNPGKTLTDIALEQNKSKKPLIIGAVAGVAVLVAVVVGLVVSGNSSKKEEEAAALAQQEAMLEQRRAELANTVIDSADPTPQTDSITGMTIPTAGSLTQEAMGQLGSAATAQTAVATLERVANLGYASSANAYATLGALSARGGYLDSTVLVAVETVLPQNYHQAHIYNEKAVELDPTNATALYELACDYLAGDNRGVAARDLDRAKELLVKGYPAAKASANPRLIAGYEKWMDQLGIKAE